MPNKIGGTAFLKIDGEQFNVADALTVVIDDSEREGQVGLSEVAGYTERPIVPYVEATIFRTDKVSVIDLRATKNATVLVEESDGRVSILRNAWCAKAMELDVATGKLSVRFEGMQGEELEGGEV